MTGGREVKVEIPRWPYGQARVATARPRRPGPQLEFQWEPRLDEEREHGKQAATPEQIAAAQ